MLWLLLRHVHFLFHIFHHDLLVGFDRLFILKAHKGDTILGELLFNHLPISTCPTHPIWDSKATKDALGLLQGFGGWITKASLSKKALTLGFSWSGSAMIFDSESVHGTSVNCPLEKFFLANTSPELEKTTWLVSTSFLASQKHMLLF